MSTFRRDFSPSLDWIGVSCILEPRVQEVHLCVVRLTYVALW